MTFLIAETCRSVRDVGLLKQIQLVDNWFNINYDNPQHGTAFDLRPTFSRG